MDVVPSHCGRDAFGHQIVSHAQHAHARPNTEPTAEPFSLAATCVRMGR